MKWLGALMVVAGCSGWGFLMAANDQKEEKQLRQLLQALSYLQNELAGRMWPLPTLFCQVADMAEGELRAIFREIGAELDKQETPNASQCVDMVLSNHSNLLEKCRVILCSLGKGLGSFDLEGQLREIESRRRDAQAALDRHCEGKTERLRCYRTLGICAGCALALLLI